MAAILNTLPANIALLDEKGLIIDINDEWRHFADKNKFTGDNYGIGSNYVTIAAAIQHGYQKETENLWPMV